MRHLSIHNNWLEIIAVFARAILQQRYFIAAGKIIYLAEIEKATNGSPFVWLKNVSVSLFRR
jgi:hypothetical protein